MTGKFLKIFVKIPISTCFFENFGKNGFAIDNRVFRVFVEIPIGKILALFFVFPATWEREQIDPPLSCCWENVKKCQNFTYGYFDENSKNRIINRETFFCKIFEKTRTYGKFDENIQKLAHRLRVKCISPVIINLEFEESTLLIHLGISLGRPDGSCTPDDHHDYFHRIFRT